MNAADVIVVGLGGLGAVVAHDLARSGARVVALDRFAPGHARGSSHGRTRVIRKAYFEHVSYVPLLERSYLRWTELDAEHPETLLDLCGVLQVGPRDGVVVPGVLQAAATHALPIEHLGAAALRAHYPEIACIADHEEGVYEPSGGILAVETCVRAWASRAERLGAHLRTGVSVHGYSHERDRWRVITDRGDVFAERLVLCPGAWACQLLPTHLSGLLTVKRKSLFWFGAPAGLSRTARFPVWLFEEPDGVFYGFPSLDEHGFKVAEHSGGQDCSTPLALDRRVNADDRARVSDLLSRRFASVDTSAPRDHTACMYTLTPDEHPMLGAVEGFHHLYVGAGLSGHGFKMVPALGEALAAQVVGERPAHDVNWLSPDRFR